MQTETTYTPQDLESGICSCCEQETEELYKYDTRCIDCIEEEKFIDLTANQLKDFNY